MEFVEGNPPPIISRLQSLRANKNPKRKGCPIPRKKHMKNDNKPLHGAKIPPQRQKNSPQRFKPGEYNGRQPIQYKIGRLWPGENSLAINPDDELLRRNPRLLLPRDRLKQILHGESRFINHSNLRYLVAGLPGLRADNSEDPVLEQQSVNARKKNSRPRLRETHKLKQQLQLGPNCLC